MLDDSIVLVIVVYSYRYFMLGRDELWSHEGVLDAWDREGGRDIFVDSFLLASHVDVRVIVLCG